MLVSLVLIVVTLGAIFTLALLWRRECRRADVPVRPYVFWLPALLGLIAAVVFVGVGMPAGAIKLLHDIHTYQPQAEQLIAGAPLEKLGKEQLPLLGLIHALQAELADHPSAAGWQSLSQLYSQLTEQTELDASDMAVTTAKRALALAPNAAEQQLRVAQVLIEANGGKLNDAAKQQLDKVLQQHPQFDGAWLMQAMAAAKAGDYALAETSFAALLAHHPHDKASELLQKSLEKVKKEGRRAAHFAHIEVRVTAGKADPAPTGGTLFVFVQLAGASGKPLAAKRVLLDKLPLTLRLTAGDWLGAFPAVDAKLVVGGRYAKGAGASVAASQPLTSVPLRSQQGALQAQLQLR